MIEIYFQNTLDAKKIYQKMCEYQLEKNFQDITVSYDQANLVTAHYQKQSFELLKALIIPVLSNFILKTKEDQWMLAIIANFFYFTDYEEQQQIISIAHSILEGEIREIPEIHKVRLRGVLIEQSLDDFLKDTLSFSFESFWKFRLKKYNDLLFQLTEKAIDEYKMEQDYQSFINTLREFLDNREPKLVCLHLLHHDQMFRFFNEQFIEINREEVKLLIDRKLILEQPIYIDSSLIGPLVSIAPKIINLYTNDIDNNVIQTILSIFQEKVNVYSIQDFDKISVNK